MTLELIRRWLALQLYAVPLALLQGGVVLDSATLLVVRHHRVWVLN